MPIMQLYYPQGQLDSARKAALAQKLTDVLIKMEGGANTTAGRAFATVMMTEVDPESWFVGGRLDAMYVAKAGKFVVYVTIPEGYMNAAQKTEVHSWVNAAIVETMGCQDDPHAGANIMVIINEVPEGNWGANGKTIGMDYIPIAVGLSKQSERYKWVESYFAAKERALKAAGFPEDMGGVTASALAATS
jgi:phenylpyruvate tautomerase PptA (4-oxalocrotonate tautomerase family)